VRSEVKEAALAQLAQAGPAGLSISAIGKQLGVSGPALYRYFASRDDLLTELVIDAYQDLADALTAAASQAPSQDSRARLAAVARAYRAWALAQPHRYRLLFGPPLPGYDAHAARLVAAAWAAMNCLLGILREPGKGEGEAGQGDSGEAAPDEGFPGEGVPGDGAAAPLLPLPQPLAGQLIAWAEQHAPGTGPATALNAVLIWSRLHGIVSLEIAGNFASMGLDPGQLFEIELSRLSA
jgi:AcrR family transcriptional regulator